MSIGSVLVGATVALVVAAYLARPFRATKVSTDVDRTIEAWVAHVRTEGVSNSLVEMEKDAEPVNFCSQCGRRVGPNDRFCPGCGTRLQEGRK